MNLKELQKELNTLQDEKLNEDYSEVPENEKEIEEEKRMQEVVKRYEKMFGRIKGLDSYRSNAGSIAGKSIVSSVPASKKSKVTEFSTISQREAYEKLKKLDEEENKIRKEKDELLQFLELRSQLSGSSSRPATVASLVQHKLEKKIENKIENKKPQLSVVQEVEKPQPNQPKRKKEADPVDELFKNLY